MAGAAWSSSSYPGYLVFQTRNTSGALATALTLDYQKKGIFAGDLTVQGTTTHLENNVLIGNSSADYLEVRYNNSADYATRLKFNGLQMGNNGANKIIAGRTAANGYFDFYTNNTNEGIDSTPDGTISLTLQADGDAILHQNVGIGTSGPGAKLNVFTGGNSIAAAAVLQHDTFAADRKVGLGFELGDTQIKGAVGFISDDSSVGTHGRGNLIFCVDSNDDAAPVSHSDEKMRITHAGKVGMGITNPATNLHVHGTTSYGSIRISPTSTNGESAIAFFLDTAGTTTGTAWVAGHAGWGHTNDFVIGNQTFGGPVMLLQTDGKVGLGTTAPSELLTLNKSSGAVGILLEGDGTDVGKFKVVNAGVNHAVQIGTISNNEIQFHTADTEKMRIDGAGAIQIGGTTNAGFIDFDGTSLQFNTQRNPNTGTFVNTSKSHASIIMSGADADSSIKFYTTTSNNTTGTLRWTIDKNGALIKNGGTSSQFLMADGSVSTSSFNGGTVANATTFSSTVTHNGNVTMDNSGSGDRSLTISTTTGGCLLYTSPSPRDRQKSRMPSSA